MKKISLLVALLFILIFTGCSDEDRSFSIDQVDIEAQIESDGTIHVKELYTYNFDGSFEGTTRDIMSDAENFQAYLAPNSSDRADISTENLDKLKVETEDEQHKIYTASEDERKQVLYTYDIIGSVTKYNDVADLTYAFFDSSNETDLHNVTTTIYTPERNISDQTNFFLRGDSGDTTVNEKTNSIEMYQSIVDKDKDYQFRLVFPASELTDRPVDKARNSREKILVAEADLAKRYDNFDQNFNSVIPILISALIITTLVGIGFYFLHPNRKNGDESRSSLLKTFEKTDPLFMKYVYNGATLVNEDVIAGLFSLKQRQIISISEVDSIKKKEEKTFRFTWHDGNELDEKDAFMKQWLFTEKDENGTYFLLESITTTDQDDEKENQTKAKSFSENFSKWKKLVQENESFQNLKKPFRAFSVLSLLLVVSSIMLIINFYQMDVVSPTIQWVIPVILTILAIPAVIFSRQKIVLSIYFMVAFIMSIVITMHSATLLLIAFVFLSWIIILIIPANYWQEDIRRLKVATKQAKELLETGNYPIGTDPNKIEEMFQYALILKEGESFTNQYYEISPEVKLTNYPLLNNPSYTINAFDPSFLIVMSVATHTTTTTSISTTGGGGAGAF